MQWLNFLTIFDHCTLLLTAYSTVKKTVSALSVIFYCGICVMMHITNIKIYIYLYNIRPRGFKAWFPGGGSIKNCSLVLHIQLSFI